jgi:hypothetical protein
LHPSGDTARPECEESPMRTRVTNDTTTIRLLAGAAITLLLLGMCAVPVRAQQPLPFAVGEKLVYSVSVKNVKTVGKGTMQVSGPVDVRGSTTWLLRFDFQAGLGPIKAVDRTESWLDPDRVASLRFSKHERHPLGKSDQRVELFPAERRWTAENGESGESLSDAPLDELSFMYFLRTVPLLADSTYRFDRHFENGRNPTTVRVVRREPVTTKAGRFETVLVEMRVRDAKHYKGDGVIRIHLTDDALRLPVRIESAMPVVGTAVLSLESYTEGGAVAITPQR